MSNITIGFKEMIAAADAAVESISPEQARELVDDDNVVLVDIRDVRELDREGMIPGAFHCPRGMVEFWSHPESPYHKPIFAEDKKFIFYCASGWRSALTTKAVQDMGLSPVAHLAGGFNAWRDAGGPVAERPSKSKG